MEQDWENKIKKLQLRIDELEQEISIIYSEIANANYSFLKYIQQKQHGRVLSSSSNDDISNRNLVEKTRGKR